MKKIVSITAVFMALMISCTKVEVADNNTNPLPMPEKGEVTVQGLGITPKTNYVVVGEPVQLEVSYSPEEAVAGTVSWTSSDPTVATVDAEGKVTTLAVGIARITASMEGVSTTAIVNVFAERVPATEIKLSKTEVNLLVGRAANVKSSLLPENTTDSRNLEWTSSDEKVAVVSFGYIQAVGMGECTVTAKQDDLTATVKVTVADKIKLIDRSDVWTVTDTPKWDKNWSGKITGSHVDVTVGAFDGEYAYFGIVDATKFEGVEAVSNAVYEQVVEKQDAGESPKNLFNTGETFTKSYSEMGDAVAYLLAYDAEFEFTGEYVVYNFEARTPDPVHATGIQFAAQSGYNYSPVTELQIKEGKSTRIQVSLLPEDCTDTGSITLTAADPTKLSITPYYPQYYENQFTVSAQAEGTTKLIATYNNVVSELDVTITGSGMTWTDKSSSWTGEFKMGKLYGYYDVFGFSLTSCTSSSHLIVVVKASDAGSDPMNSYKTVASQNEGNLNWYASSDLPDFNGEWGYTDQDEYYAYIFGVSAGDYDGNYAIYHYDPNAGSDEPGGDEPGGGTEGKIVSFDAQGQYLKNTFDSIDATQDELTLEGWFNPSSLTGGGDNIRVLWGTEGIFLLRYESNKLHLVYGGKKRTDKNEYEECNLTYSTNMTVNEWHHIAATYKRNEKARLYVDGVEVVSGNAEDHAIELNGLGAQWDLPFSFIIGAAGQPKRNFLGSMAYLRVWDVARTATEIANNMNVADPADEGENLIASWYFTEGSGNTIADHGCTEDYDITSNGTLNWIDGTLPF